MLRSLFVSAGLLLATPALACPMADAAAFAAAAEVVQQADGTKVSLAVDGMHCGDCSDKVTTALKGIDGVNAVAVDYQNGVAEIAYDSGKTDVSALVAAVTAAGFKAQQKKDA